MIIHEKHTHITLNDYDLHVIKCCDLDEVWYDYQESGYDGRGQMIMRKGDLYDHHDMGHCSCYGPCDQIVFNGKPLEELKSSLQQNNEYWEREIKPVFEAYEL